MEETAVIVARSTQRKKVLCCPRHSFTEDFDLKVANNRRG